ncbi:MAG: hypothetical protein FJX52_13055 [Alphaproteobacteria bacterium]|nr:hypothetical protein [Alphaproteobacteria bacterium]
MTAIRIHAASRGIKGSQGRSKGINAHQEKSRKSKGFKKYQGTVKAPSRRPAKRLREIMWYLAVLHARGLEAMARWFVSKTTRA